MSDSEIKRGVPPQTYKSTNKVPHYVMYLVLASAACINFGNYYIFDVPQELAGAFLKEFNLTPANIELLYTIYSIPSIFMAFLGGFIVKSLSARTAALMTSYFTLMSAVVTAFGVYFENYNMVIGGRVIYGIFGEICMVA